MANRIQLRRGGAQEWANANPTLAQGELGIELDTGRFKIGDGVSAWNTLRYERPVESISNTANTLVQRDADGNFAAGVITATLIGNSSTAARLSSTRQITLSDDLSATGTFDGSQNLNLAAELSLVSTLPHYDGTSSSSGTYNKVTVDAKGRITAAQDFTTSNNGTLADYGLDGTVEGASAQPYDLDLVAVAGLTTTGIIARTSGGAMSTRTVTGTAGKIQIQNGAGVNGNPTINLITTTVVPGDYNTESLTSVSAVGSNNEPFGTETVNAVKFTVDEDGRLQSSTNVPIATATEGSKYGAFNGATNYVRYNIIETGGKVYQAIQDISSGGVAPTHVDSSDANGWRYLAAAAVEQKGLASFAQEDFDVDSNGHVTIAPAGVDNTQMQNNRIGFADGNTVENFELDQELTATTGYRGFNYLNYVKVNNTSGSLLFGANNTGDSGNGEVDINVRTVFSDPDFMFDGAGTQQIDKTGDGDFNIELTQNTAVDRNLTVSSTNAGSGTSTLTLSAEDVVDIDATAATGKVHIETMRFQADHIGAVGDILIDPNDDRDVSGLVTIRGNLQVDGTTTTVNSTVTTLDDPIITLGGDTAPASDDGKDRGVEFRYYDTQARLGFFGYDDSYADLGGHSGGFRFLYDATNTGEVFGGTDAGVIAGNLKLTTNTNSTSNTTGDLVVAGGVGIGDDVNIGGSVDIDTNFRTHGTSRFDDEVVIQGASKNFIMKNGSGTAKITAGSTTGNITMEGILAVTGNVDVNTDKFNITASSGNTAIAGTLVVSDATTIKADNKFFKIQTAAAADKFTVDTDNGNTVISGELNVNSAVDLDTTLNVDGGATFQDNVTINADNKMFKIQTNGSVDKFTVDSDNGNTVIAGQLNVNSAVDLDSTLNVDNASTFQHNVTINADNKMFKIQNNSNSDKFTVDTDNGNTTIQGTVDIVGNTTLTNNFTVNGSQTTIGNASSDVLTVNADATFTDDLTVNATVDFDSTLNVDGQATFQDNIILNANNKMFKIQTNSSVDKFTVDSDNGNTDIQGTLTVQGQTSIIDSLVINASNENFLIQNGSGVNKFTVDTDNGNTNIVGTITVGSASQINSTLGVTGVTSLTNAADQTLTGTYGADGGVRISGGVGITKRLAVGSDARVYGNTTLSGTVDIDNNTDVSGKFNISNTQDATSFADNSVAFTNDGGARITKNTYIGGDLVVYDNTNTRAAFTVTNLTGDGEFHNDLTVGGNLIVNGATTTVNSTVTTLDDPVITLGGDTAPVSNDAKDRGVEFRYYDGSAKVGYFGLDRSSLEFAFLTDATNNSEIFTGTDGALRVGSIHVTGAGQSVDIDSNANIDGTLTVDGQITSQVSSGPALVIPTTDKINNLNADLLDSMTTASANTGSTVVNRDSSGDFAANIITVASGTGSGAGIQGNAITADEWKTARTLTVNGVVNGSISINGGSDITLTTTFDDPDITGLSGMTGTGYVVRTAANTFAQRTLQVTGNSGITLTNADGVQGDTTINVASTPNNASDNLVLRDGSGNFSAGEITADLSGNLIANSSTAKTIIPVTDSAWNLGSNSARWLHIYGDSITATDATITNISGDLTGNLVASSSTTKTIVPSQASQWSIGHTTNRYSYVYADNFIGTTAQVDVNGDLTGNLVASSSTAKTVVPAANSTWNLGSTANRWAYVYADTFTGTTGNIDQVNGNLSGNLVASNSSTKNIIPAADSTWNIGSSTNRYAYIYGDSIVATSATIDQVNGDLSGNLVANSTSTKTVIPDQDSNWNLGSTASRYAYAYADTFVGDTANIGQVNGDLGGNLTNTSSSAKTIVPAANSTWNLGSTANRWAYTYSNSFVGTSATIDSINGDLGGNLTNNSSTAKTFIPVQDNTWNLGSTTNKWAYGYINTVNGVTGTFTTLSGDLGGNLTNNSSTAKTFIPVTGSTWNLGSGTNRWAYLYVDTINVTNAISANVTGDLTGNADTATALQTARTIGGTTFDGTADITPATATQATNLNNHDTDSLSEGASNLYYTETRVQNKLDNAFAQLQAMLNNLATTTTLKLNLSGDPTPGAVVSLGSITASGLGGFTAGTDVATSGSATGTGLTVDTTVVDGAITAVALNQGGTDYLIGDTLTITNANAGGVATLNLGSLVTGTGGFSNATAVATTGGSGTGLTLDTTVDASGALTNLTVNAAGTGYANGETITLTNPNAGGVATTDTLVVGTGYIDGTGLATTGGGGSGLTVDVTTSGGQVTGVTVNAAGTGYAVDDTITITNPNGGGVQTLGSIATAGTGYADGTGIAVVGGGGTGLTVDLTTSAGVVTGVAINADGSGYAASDVVTIVNANGSGAKTLGSITTAGTGYSAGTGVATTSAGSGTGLTVDTTVDENGAITAVTINDDGSGYAASEVITIAGGSGTAQFTVSEIHGNGCTIPISAVFGNDATFDVASVFVDGSIDIATVFTDATFSLADITAMEVGATLTGATSGTVGTITAMDSSSVTVDNVDGFFKVGETVGANDVTNLTINSFG